MKREELASKSPRKLASAIMDPRLGKMSDRELGPLLGISSTTVLKARNLVGLPVYDPCRDYREKIVNHPMLGMKTDGAIAKDLGVSENVVRHTRHRYTDIPAYVTHGVHHRPPSNSEIGKAFKLAGWL